MAFPGSHTRLSSEKNGATLSNFLMFLSHKTFRVFLVGIVLTSWADNRVGWLVWRACLLVDERRRRDCGADVWVATDFFLSLFPFLAILSSTSFFSFFLSFFSPCCYSVILSDVFAASRE